MNKHFSTAGKTATEFSNYIMDNNIITIVIGEGIVAVNKAREQYAQDNNLSASDVYFNEEETANEWESIVTDREEMGVSIDYDNAHEAQAFVSHIWADVTKENVYEIHVYIKNREGKETTFEYTVSLSEIDSVDSECLLGENDSIESAIANLNKNIDAIEGKAKQEGRFLTDREIKERDNLIRLKVALWLQL